MKKLNITKEQFNKSRYFKNKYGKLEYVSESGKLFKTNKGKVLRFNEAGPHRVADDEDLDIPVTEQEELLCKYIPDEIEEFCRKNGLEVTCGCNPHNTGEEQHIEIYVGIPEGDDPTDPKYDNIEENLEMLVNGIGDAENEGEKWGDASFQWISDEEIFGELWPIDEQGRGIDRGKYAESKGFGKKFAKESSVRNCTNELIDYAEAYPNFWETIAKACLSYMSEDEVEDMARMNDLLPDDDEYTDY